MSYDREALETPCRCEACGALLAKLDRNGITIQCGDMQVVVSGESTVAITCYRDSCRALNVLSSRKPTLSPITPSEFQRRLLAAWCAVRNRR